MTIPGCCPEMRGFGILQHCNCPLRASAVPFMGETKIAAAVSPSREQEQMKLMNTNSKSQILLWEARVLQGTGRGFGVCVCRTHSDLCCPSPQQTPARQLDTRLVGNRSGIVAGQGCTLAPAIL